METTKVTGNDDAAGADPGGTHSTQPGHAVDGTRKLEETVISGDRNTRDESKIPDDAEKAS